MLKDVALVTDYDGNYPRSDRTPADGKYLIIGVERRDLIVTDGEGIYKTGEQIVTSKLNARVGQPATTQIRTIRFNDEDAIAPLQQLQSAYPNAAIYLSGSITVDFPEEIKLPLLPNQYQSISLSGAMVNLKYQPIEGAIAVLKDQYAIGSLTAKIITPRPFQ